MPYDELRVLYKQHLHSLNISKATINTASVDTFYLWRKDSKTLFWDTVLSNDFESEARSRLLKTLSDDSYPLISKHVETVALLSRLNVDKHISVEVTMDELDLTSAESKATYKKIKDYILENTGLKVSNLNIAQVKRKYGIIKSENYNIAKSEDGRVPNCTKEKEDAIVDAFKYFKMI